MIDKPSLKTLLKRRITKKDLPIVVHRRRWAAALAAAIVPILMALAVLLAVSGVGAIPDYVADGANEGIAGLIRSLIGTAAWILMCPLCLIAAFLGIDRSFGYRLMVERDGLRFDGVLTDRLLVWQEIREIRLKPRVFIPALDVYQIAHVAIYVNGSNHPRRHWSSLWFGYYDIPPLMEYGGKELTALLRHAKRHADLNWPDALPRKIRKSA